MSPDIELIYELSPMQQAMLFHSLYAPGTGIYVLQMSLRLTGRLNVPVFERAWRRIVERHGILRSAFYWENLESPRQVVFRNVGLEVARESWRGLSVEEQRERLARFLDEDRARGFELSEAPLMRLTLIELAKGLHQLVWTQHHLVVDGWSQGQVLKELLSTYAAFTAGREPRQEKPRGFADYIGWLRRQDLSRAEAFWRESLAGFTAPTFIANGVRNGSSNGRGRVEGPSWQESRRRDLTLPSATSAALREVARRHRLTLNTVVQGAWTLLLAQVTGREDVVFGATAAGRPTDLPGVESIIGPFINTLPVRVEVRPERRVREWLAALQESQVAMRRAEHAPLVDVQRWSEVPAGVALFDHVLVFENLTLPAELSRPLPDLEIVEEAASSLANYPLMVVALPGRDLTLSLRYDAGRFEDVRVARMLEHLTVLLTALAEDRDAALGELPLLGGEEWHQVLLELNDTRSEFPREASLPGLFAAVAAATPEAPAVVEENGETWSYRRLDEESNRLARHLRRQGVAPGARVGVAMERSAELIVALLGILKAGAAYVPLDPGLPEERLRFLVEDSGVSIVLPTGAAGDAPRGVSTVGNAAAPLEIPASALAYVIYTSGSTGRPKGVAVSHRAIVRLVMETDYLTLRADDRLAFNANTSFDAATFEIWATLLHGGALVVISREELLAPAVLAERLERERVTVLHLTAALFAQVAREAPAALAGPRCVLFGGEASAPALVARALEEGRPRRLLQMYGPTESTTFATWQPINEVPPGATTVPIGRPLANTTAVVLDRWQQPAPLEQTGELFLGGEGLAWGYWNRPDLTAERFVPDPWSAEPGGRLYRTGDLVRRRTDGVLEFQGRIDDQVKIRGFRIEPGEVEAVLSHLPGVEACTVVVRRDEPGDARLAAYVVAAGLRESDLRRSLQGVLPEYMVPSAWVFLEALPLTANGKVDRRALPAPERISDEAQGSAAPFDPVEELLAGIWAEVLGLDRVGVHDSFFELGGHSLLATQVVSRIRAVLDVDLPLRELFASPTVAELARAVRQSRGGRQAPPILPVPRPRDQKEPDLPLSFAQQRLWFLDRMEPGSAAYNMPFGVRVQGGVEPDRLARIFSEVVRRHEVLRTTFAERDGRPVQVIRAEHAVELPVVDLTGLCDRSDFAVRQIAREEAGRPFDLQRGPLLRLALLRLGERDWLLLVTMHHVVSDGWSMGVLLREIAVLYEAFFEERPSPLPELPVQYADYAVWQRDWLQGDVLQGEIEFWRRQLAGAPHLLELPTDRPRPALQTFRGATRPVALAPDLSPALAALCREKAATPFMVLLAAWALLLGRHAGQDDVVVGSPVAGRNQREIEELIGCFLNLLAFRVELIPLTGAPPTFGELLGRVRERALDAYVHQALPFERLVEEVVHERDLAISPLFQALFSLQNVPSGAIRLPGLELTPVAAESAVAKFDVSLYLTDGAEGIIGSLEFNSDLFDGTTAERLAERFACLVAGAVADPACPLGDLPLLAPAQRDQLLAGWNATAEAFPQELCVHELVGAQVARTPEAPAVSCAGERWTYRELWDEAGRLAERLVAMGVGPEVLVAIRMERSPRMLAALLGVLRAGGAYVPLDPAHPQERLAHILEDARARVVVTDEGLQETGVEGPHPSLSPIVLPENLAYVIYTSGSTGRPKGVGVRHRGVVNYLATMARRPGMSAADAVVAVTTLSFDIAVTELLLPLTVGARIELVGRETAADAVRLAATLESAGATVFQATPATWTLLVEGGWKGRPGLKALCGGEALPRALAEKLLSRPLGIAELWNVYGPTETTVWSAVCRVSTGSGAVQVGSPLGNTTIHLVGRWGELVPPGAAGELLIGGAGLARGYHGRPDLTAERFVPDPFGEAGARLYRTGDLARRRSDGTLEVLGRIDFQVKIRGFRIEPGEIEAVLASHPQVREFAVVARRDVAGSGGEARLVGYVVPRGEGEVSLAALREHLRARLPEYMVPSAFVVLPAFPLNASGKVDRKALPVPAPAASPSAVGRHSELEAAVAGIWCEVLGVPRVGFEDNFFDLGGHSLLLPRIQARLRERLGREVSLVDLLTHTSVRALARHLEPGLAVAEAEVLPAAPARPAGSGAIAIVGLSGRFPGASSVEDLWANLSAGVSSIARLSDEELAASGVDPALRRDPRYVPAAGVLDGVELFDAGFFGFSPREAEVMDPQQRLFLECAWEALEDAGYDSKRTPGPVGMFAGVGFNRYLHQLLSGLDPAAVGGLQIMVGNDKDFLATRVSYKLDLEGPSMTVQTACSSSLVAVHLACQNLLLGACDMALAGGIAISLPQRAGYLYEEGGIASPDGYCRAFDAEARGTVGGSGVGIVVLKRLEDALAHGDTIRAVLLGSAVNNDGGSGKAGYTAPSVPGQAAVISAALAAAGVDPATVSYVEAHGSGTPLGDPVEVQALARAFRRGGARERSCALGSIKSNIGHLDTAAGVAGLIKTTMALQHGLLPPSLGFSRPNPQIDFAAGPFHVQTELAPWERGATPRRAGVSSFGIGGTNAHVVVEEAPPAEPSGPSRPWQVLLLSARTATALERATDGLAARLEDDPGLDLADAAHTLRVGRRPFAHRRAVVAADREEAAAALRSRDTERVWTASLEAGSRSVAFLLPGVGDQYPGLAQGLYRDEPVFRREIDLCAGLLLPHLGLDLREILFNAPEATADKASTGPDLRALLGRGRRDDGETAARALLQETRIAQPVMFAVSHALARLWMSWGVQPAALLGYSLGEYTAACLAGVMELPDALALVARRARLIGELAPGAMLAVPLPEEETRARLGEDLALAAVNAPGVSVVAGPPEAIARLERQLAEEGLPCRRLQAAQAFHSWMLEPIADALRDLLRSIPLAPPRIPYLSNVTGTWIEPDQAMDPDYWARHLVSTVRFSAGVAELWRAPGRVLIEMGPQALGTLALQQIPTEGGADRLVLTSLRHALDRQPDQRFLLQSLGRLWLAGAEIDWSGFQGDERRRRVPLPAYPFERQRYWVEGRSLSALHQAVPQIPERLEDISRWFHVPTWKRVPRPVPLAPVAGEPAFARADGTYVIVDGAGSDLAGPLQGAGAEVSVLTAEEVSEPALERALEGARGFLVLFSAFESAAADVLGAFARSRSFDGGTPVLAIHWCRGLTVDEQMEALDRILDSGLSEVVVSNRDLAEAFRAAVAAAEPAGAAAPASAPGRRGHARPALATPWVAPATPTEDAMALVWGELLGIEPIGINDNFFELGGHSLLGLQLISRLQARFGVELPLGTLFEAPTVAALAREVEDRRRRGETAGAPPIVPVPRDGGLPLSFAQQRLWLLDRLDPGSAAYNIPFAVRLRGMIDSGLLVRIFAEVVRRHEALRTTFDVLAGEPVQVIAAPYIPALPVIDLADLPEARREALARELAGEEARRPFDLQRGPLLRLGLVRLGEGDGLLLLNIHHSVSDGWSIGVLMREIGALGEAFARGDASPLPELPVQYADYAVWQRRWLQGAVLEGELDYWKRQLAGAPPVLELPTDRPRSAVQTFRGATRPVALASVPELAALCRRAGATPFMALLAAWALLLGRHAGQDEVVVGSPVAARNRREIEDLIGFFVNTLVLRTGLGGPGSTFGDLLGRVREVALGAFAHQDLPFERLVEELVHERDLAISPLFQVLLTLQSYPSGAFRVPGLELTPILPESEVAKFDLSLYLFEGAERIDGFLEFNTDLFDGATAERLAERFVRLVAGAAAHPELPIGDLPLLLPAELDQLLTGWNDTAEPFPEDLCVHELIAAQAARTPDAVAVSFEGERLIYRELMARAGLLADRLVALGVGPDILVGLRAERSPALLVGMLGVLKAGGAYVPLDPTHPQERLEYILEDAGVRVVVKEEGVVEGRWEKGSGGEVHPENLAYVIYTSGSTGRPKGVGVRHRGVVNYLTTMAQRPGFSSGDVVMALTTLSFDIAVTELLLPLTVGARVELVSRETAGDAALLAAAVESSGATVMQATPATWMMLVEGGWTGRPGLRALCGGEALPRALADKLLSRVGELWNVYGPTETTVWSTRHRVTPGDRQVSLGLPLGNTTIHLLGRWGELVPPGAAGELLIGGAGLARGYHGRPDLTAERFVPDPFGAPGTRLYRTGDLARRLPDGTLEYLGRIDFQVKVRGFRIELGEIEAVLGSHPEVRECVVVARDGALAAYVVPRDADATRPEELRGHLRARLPEYMVPSFFVALESFPRTSSGKVDRKALPSPDRSRLDAESYVAPADPVEELLAGIWAEVLGLERVGTRDHFFALGGHSLLATRVVSRIREAFGVEVPLRRLFEMPTVAELARVVRESRAGVEAPPILPVSRDVFLPLSFAQQRLWLLDQLEPGSAVYNMPFAVRLRGAVEPALLERVFAAIVRRHEVLRTTFGERNGQPLQVIVPQARPELPVVDLAHLPDEEREERARALAGEEARRPFDLRRGPLLRCALLRLDPRDWILLVNMHHIVSDGWSQGVLLRDFAALAQAFAAGRPSPLPELPVQYADFAVWQRGWLQGAVLDEQLGYWTRQLAGAPRVLELPTDRPRGAVQTFRGAAPYFTLPAALSQAVAALGRQAGVTPFMALLAAWSVLLGRHAGQDDVLVGSPVAGRNRREVEDLIGFFVNTLVLRSDLSGTPAFRELLGRVRETALGAFAHQDVPFERLVEAVVEERDLAVSPLFQVLFVLQNPPAGEIRLPGVALTPLEGESGVAKFDLSLYLTDAPGGLLGALEHNTDLFDAGTAERLVSRFIALVEGAVAEPGRPVGELPLLLPAELEQLRTGWNGTAEPFPADLCVHELVAAQAAQTPEAVAVSFEGERLFYRELEERASRLADQLVALGVGPEVLVGLRAERTPALLVSLLGVLKAGGAYVPLDPTHPRERLEYILADAGVEVLVTEGGLVEGRWERGAKGKVHPENLAYVIYTSGSTGRPKGVGVRHGGVVNYLTTMATLPGLSAGDVMMAVTTLSFDIAVTELLLPLTVGARVELVSRETAGDSALLAAALESSGATVMQATPATWTMLVEGGWQGRPGLKALCGGEALPRALADKLLPRVGELWNVYGPTETTVWSTRHRVTPGDRQVSLGLPLGNTTIHLLGRWGELVPQGAAGELLIGGAGLARGYYGRPDLTAERFVPDSFGQPGDRLYRTGDLARRLPDGTLEYLGRIDFQVKVRGFRIELGEIDAVLGSHPEVRACVVVARNGALVAYVVPRDAHAARPDDLRAHLRARLPEYMVPSFFVPMDIFPLTPSGKVDRKALPAPDRARSAAEIVAPRTRTEEVLVEMWKGVLGLDRVSVEDGFFELGGHSLLAAQLRSRIRQTLGLDLPLAEIFRHPTVAGLAGVIDAQSATVNERELAELLDALARLSDEEAQACLADPRALLDRLGARERREVAPESVPELVRLPRPATEDGEAAFPLSFAQQRLWFLDQLEPGNPVYNIPLPVRLHGELPVVLLERIFAEIVRRHEALRTTFAEGNDEPLQIIHSALRPALPVLDLSHLPAGEREERARQIAQEEAYRPFDLRTGPLLRLSAVRLAEREWLLLVTMHHIVSDGWSLGVMLREIAALFAAFSAGRPSPLPELPVQYADFSVWQRQWLRGKVLEEQLSFWKRRLAGAPAVLELSTDRPRPAVQTYRGAAVSRFVAPEVSATVRELCRRLDVTPFMALLAAWSLLLGRHANQEDVVIGTPVAGRHRQETQDLIGFFVNTLALRTDLSGAPGFGELVERVSRASLEAFIHQDLPFERIVEELVAERDPSHAPLFQVMFSVQSAGRNEEFRLPGLTLAPVSVESRMAKFDLTLTLVDGPEGFAGTLEHNTDLFDAHTAARLLARFEILLAAAAADPGRPAADLSLLLPEERQQMLVEWNDAVLPSQTASFPELFAAAARAFPDEPAVISSEGEAWSYRRLDEASNRLARKLRALGVGSDQAVGICMERAPELILGVVAVLKAGGVYLPLNPANPDERLLFQLDDTGAGLVLVHRGTRERLEERRRLEVDSEAWSGPRAGGDASPLGVPVPAESLAYIIYTSGSTGLPKGVGVPHGAAMIHSGVIVEDDALRPGERVVQFSSLSFDVSLEQMLPTLISGAAVVLRDEELANPDEMLRGFARLGVTSANLPTVYWHQAVQSWTAESAPPLPLRLRVQCVGGEAMLPEAARRWMALAGPLGLRGVRLINGYGPTETVVTATRFTVPDSIPPGASSVSIGRTLPFRAAYVISARGDLQPIGVPGELCLGGVMARGYVNRPELTAEKFVPNPWSNEPGARMYRTGDLVRQLPGGELDYLGRIDRQVKVRGFRIEPGEIEAVLAALPPVRDCAVLARRDTPGETRLVAYVVPALGAGLTAIAVRELLREKLPDYMVPAAVVFLEALPLTPNGKVDRKALPAPDRTLAPEEGFVPPRDEIELQVAAIWEELLDVRPVGLHDSFFALGGHSLLALRLVGSIERQLGSRIPLAALIAAPTVETIARLVREEVSLPRSLVVPLEPGPTPTARSETPLFLVHPVGGNVFCYLPLARLGGLEVPVYGIQAPEAEALSPSTPWTLETLAAHYVATLREIRPEGPYRLAGWSLGGAVAFEMARQLTGQGSEVALLAMIDPGPPRQGPEVPDPRLELAQFVHDLRGLAGLDTSRAVALPAGAETLDDLLACAEVRALLPADVTEDQIRALFALFRANVRALATYRPEPFAGRLTLLRAEATAALLPEADREWSALAHGGAEVHLLAGDHYSLLRPPHVAALSGVLAACLRGPEGRISEEKIPVEAAGAALSTVKHQLLEALLREKRAAAADAETIRQRGDLDAPAPLSFAQERMWFLHLLDPGSSAYNVVNSVRLDGTLRPGILADAFRRLIRRHEVLGTRYEMAGNQPVQVIGDGVPFRLPSVDLTGLPEELRVRELSLVETEEANRPFDLIRGPVMRVTLVHLTPAEHVMVLAIHHIAIDGWSMNILVQDLAALYSGLAAGGTAPLPAPRLQYADFAVWQRRWLRGEALERQLGYWRRQLQAPLPVLMLPTDLPRQVPQAFRSGAEEMIFPAGLVTDLLALGRTRGASLFMALLAGLTAVLHRASGDERILVGTPVAGRDRVDVERLIGFFLNNLVLRVDLDGDPGFGTHLERSAQTSLDAFAHQDLPLETLLQELRIEREGSGARGPFQVMLLLQNVPPPRIEVPGLTLSPRASDWGEEADLGAAIFELGLTVSEAGGGELRAVMVYNALLFEAATVRRLLGHLRVLLEGGAAGPGTRLSELPLLSAAEQREVLAWGLVLRDGAMFGTVGGTVARPLDLVQAHVVDRALRPVPAGIRGEVLLGGPGVARGDLGDLDQHGLTAERFLPDPFSGVAGARLYRTGDLARRRADGSLECAGRIERQVRIRGFLVQPWTVESALAASPDVAECAVVAREDGPQGPRLVVYVVPAAGSKASTAELRAFLESRLPAWMVPSAFVALPALPRTPAGALDEPSLPAADSPATATERPSVEPRNEIEEVIAEIWRDALGVETLSVFDGFFELGGHSLLLLQVMRRLRDTFELEIPLRSIYEERTVAALAKKVEELLIQEVSQIS